MEQSSDRLVVKINLRFVLPNGSSLLFMDVLKMMEESVITFETHLTAVMDSLIRASVCEITKLFQETVNNYLVELSLNRNENEALKVRLKLTENKLSNERKYGMSWAAQRRNSALGGERAAASRQKRKAELLRSKPKRALAAAYGKDWPGGVWEEGSSGGGSGGAVRAGSEAREMFVVQFPGEEEERAEAEEDDEVRLIGEGEETSNIKEEMAAAEGFRPASICLIEEALQMHTSKQNHHTPHNEGVLAVSDPPLNSERSVGGMTADELRGLESALRAEKSREQAAMKTSHMISPAPKVHCSVPPKYIGLDGLEQEEVVKEVLDLEPPTLQREEKFSQVHVKMEFDAEEAEAEEGASGWVRETGSPVVIAEDSGSEQEQSEPPPHLSAPASVGESGDDGTEDMLHFGPHCGGGFKSENKLEGHPCDLAGASLEGALEDSMFSCESCGDTFNHAWALKTHECSRALERPHGCEICGKRFTHARSLERHHLVHTGERPHRCPHCGRSFSRLANLERHQRIHTGERPYGCEACGKKFSRVEYLKKHQIIHTNEMAPIQCSTCGKGFGDVEKLKKHQCF